MSKWSLSVRRERVVCRVGGEDCGGWHVTRRIAIGLNDDAVHNKVAAQVDVVKIVACVPLINGQ